MGRIVHPTLQNHLDGDATTTCRLVRIDPTQPNVPGYGVTTLDVDVTYDDGEGPRLYSAAIGMQSTLIQSNANLSVDNAEGQSLLPEFDVPISEEDIRRGSYDFATFREYLVDYEDLTSHVTLQEGTIGQVTIDDSGLSYVNEFRGLSAETKQSICEKDSLTCRALFGSQAEGDSSGAPIERFPCGVDATALLVNGTVTSVGLENTLTFTVGGFAMAADALNPGMTFWVTGLNAGRSYEIDTNTAGGEITLSHETAWPIQVGDTLMYRVDCNKQARDTVKGCKAAIRWGDDWVLHFRGEPDIPIGDAGAMETPGASSAPGSGGSTYQPFTEAE